MVCTCIIEDTILICTLVGYIFVHIITVDLFVYFCHSNARPSSSGSGATPEVYGRSSPCLGVNQEDRVFLCRLRIITRLIPGICIGSLGCCSGDSFGFSIEGNGDGVRTGSVNFQLIILRRIRYIPTVVFAYF